MAKRPKRAPKTRKLEREREQAATNRKRLRINREFKDRLFKMLFGRSENRRNALELYNGLNGTNYTNVEDLEFVTLEDAVYMGVKNDVAFIIDGTVNLYEQQSTFNPNMPYRFFQYGSEIFGNLTENDDDFCEYSDLLQKLPAARCVCFFIGSETQPDRQILRLTDMYQIPGYDFEKAESGFETKVLALNITYGHNAELFAACRPLRDYSYFVHLINEYLKQGLEIEEATSRAIDDMPDDSPLKPFLLKNRAEVMKASLYEYDEKKTQEILKRQYMREGEKEGRKEEGHKRQLAYLRDVLKFRFSADPDETTALLREKSLEELDALSAVVFECASFEDFRERL